MLTRRKFLKCSCVCGLVAASPLRALSTSADKEGPLPEYCTLTEGSDISRICDSLVFKSGVSDLDRSLNLELFHVARVFDVQPGFAFCHEKEGANAWALRQSFVGDSTHGTVIVGLNLVNQELGTHAWGGAAVAGLIAHEFGHIYQFASPYYKRLSKNQKTMKLTELHADYLAGYYLGTKKYEGSNFDIKAFVDSIYLKGDTHFNSVEHHGLPIEREHVMITGYKRGLQGPTAISEVALSGEEFVRSL